MGAHRPNCIPSLCETNALREFSHSRTLVYHPSFIMKKPKAVREEYIRNLSKVIVEANT